MANLVVLCSLHVRLGKISEFRSTLIKFTKYFFPFNPLKTIWFCYNTCGLRPRLSTKRSPVQICCAPGQSTVSTLPSPSSGRTQSCQSHGTVRPRLSGHVGTGTYPDKWFGRIWELCWNTASSLGFIHVHALMCLLIATVLVTNYCLW